MSADTVSPNAEVGQGYNVYAYVANNPTTWVDPTGHQTAGFAPPMDNTQFIEWSRNIGDMMHSALQTFSFSAFGVWALDFGTQLGTLAALTGGVTAFNVAVGLLAVAAILAMSYLIWSCLLNQNSWCYKSSTMQGLREMASEGVDRVAECAIAIPGTTANINMTAMMDVKHHNPCAPEPEKEDKEDCKADVPYLARSASLYKLLISADRRARASRNYAVLRFESSIFGCVDMVAANGMTDFTRPQQTLAGFLGQTIAEPWGSEIHAEVTVMSRASTMFGFTRFVALGVSQIICAEICVPEVRNRGGSITYYGRGATWKP